MWCSEYKRLLNFWLSAPEVNERPRRWTKPLLVLFDKFFGLHDKIPVQVIICEHFVLETL